MKPPTSQKLVRQFIGLLEYYPGMWAIHSHTLEALTCIIPSKVKFKWNKIKQDAFLDCYTLLAYLDFNKEFKIHTDASDS